MTIGEEREAALQELRSGDYICFRVSDTGTGMDEETRDRLYEPFFTTKALGVGTGLGLSTVYGIVRQNEGAIRLKTELNHGTEFEVLLPCSKSNEVDTDEEQEEEEAPVGVGERILLVEDEPSVMKLVELMLTRLGYEVVSATNAADAIKLASKHELALLITDVIMPDMSGKEVAQEVTRLQPGLQCLYMSGYTADVIDDHGVLSQETAFLQKPFSLGQLARKVRSVLDGQGPSL
jgi:CheY-like chemotaxis protein